MTRIARAMLAVTTAMMPSAVAGASHAQRCKHRLADPQLDAPPRRSVTVGSALPRSWQAAPDRRRHCAADLEETAAVDERDRAAAGADRMDVGPTSGQLSMWRN